MLQSHDRRAKLLGLYPEPDPTANTVPTYAGLENQPVLVVTRCSCAIGKCETGQCGWRYLPRTLKNTSTNEPPIITTATG